MRASFFPPRPATFPRPARHPSPSSLHCFSPGAFHLCPSPPLLAHVAPGPLGCLLFHESHLQGPPQHRNWDILLNNAQGWFLSCLMEGQEQVVLLVLYVMGRPEHLGVPRLKVMVTPVWGCRARAQETTRMGSTSWGSPNAPHLETALDSRLLRRALPSPSLSVAPSPLPGITSLLSPTLPPIFFNFFFNWKFFSCSLSTKTWLLTAKLGLDE